MIDTHSHLNFSAYKEDGAEVLERALAKHMLMINVGAQFSTSQRAVKMAEDQPALYAAIALHPIHLQTKEIYEELPTGEKVKIVSRAEEFDYNKYKELALSSPKVVAIGETGIDYYHLEDNDRDEQKALQKKVFIEHIKLANELNLPLIIHCRDAYDDLIEILQANEVKSKGVIHCFAGNKEQAKIFLELGFYLGFTGVITFKNGVEELHEIIKEMPEDRILSETDCPYLTPEPFRGKRNEPIYVEYVIKKIAMLRNWSFEKAEKITETNAKTLFNLK